MVWNTCVGSCNRTCLDDTPICALVCVGAGCRCPWNMVIDNHQCIIKEDCPTPVPEPPAPPSPSDPPPPSPRPPNLPVLKSPPPAHTTCTPTQQAQNRKYCLDDDFDTEVCNYNSGRYCPEVCGRCSTPVATGMPRVQFKLTAAGDVHEFDQNVFKRRLARTVGVSQGQVEITVAPGSVEVTSMISSQTGEEGELAEIQQSILITMNTPEMASTALGMQMEVVDLPTTVAASPDLPPALPELPAPSLPPEEDDGLPFWMVVLLVVIGIVVAVYGVVIRSVIQDRKRPTATAASLTPLLPSASPVLGDFTFNSLK